MKTISTAVAMPLLLLALGLTLGCGGGPMHTGGLGIFAPKKLPDEDIATDDLPAGVRPLVEAETAGGTIKEIKKGVRESDGRYYYTVTYAEPDKAPTAVRYWHDGTVVYRKQVLLPE